MHPLTFIKELGFPDALDIGSHAFESSENRKVDWQFMQDLEAEPTHSKRAKQGGWKDDRGKENESSRSALRSIESSEASC